MNGRFWLPALGVLLLSACKPQSSVPDGTLIVDEDVALTRKEGVALDAASREFTINDDAILVATVDQNLTDVLLTITPITSNLDASKAIAVENNLTGTGIEIATLDVPSGTRVQVSVSNPQDSKVPGKVHLRVRQYSAEADRDSNFATQLKGLRAWTRATDAAIKYDGATKSGLSEIQSAIDHLDAPQGDKALAAEARLIKTRMLQFFKIDWRESRAEAQRTAAAFDALPKPDTVNEARAQYLDALALIEISADAEAVNPTGPEAMKLAQATLEHLTAPESVLGPIERARAATALAQIHFNMMQPEGVMKNQELARTLYESVGYTAGVREMQFAQAMLIVEMGQFADAAHAFEPLLPEIDRITDLDLRAKAYISVARAQSFSGNSDGGVELLLKALQFIRENHLRQQEATALMGLGYIYMDRWDLAQAGVFYEGALQIARSENYAAELVEALQAAGGMARSMGDHERAFKLHEEAVRRASSPVMKVRSKFDFAIDFYRKGDFPGSIARLREGLAIDLGDPTSHIFTDGKFVLAQFLAEYDKATPQDLLDAVRLNEEGRATSIKVRDQWRVIRSYRVSGQINSRLGKFAQATKDYERTLTMAQEYRQRSVSTEARSAMLLDEQYAFRGNFDIIFADVVKRGTGVVQDASPAEIAAIRRLEGTRQESFGALRVGTLDAKTNAHVDELLATMARKSLRIATLVQGDPAAGEAELHALQIEMAGLHAELDHARTSAAAALPPAREWRPLAPGAAQLTYAMAEKFCYALVRSQSGTRVVALSTGRSDLEKQLAEFSKLDVRTKSKEVETALDKISAVVMPAGLLPDKTTSVEIVAEGRIASLPFPALRSPTDPKRRLIETHEIAMVTSLFGVDEAPRMKQARPFRFVALASGNGTYRAAAEMDPTPKLHAATKEIKTAADLFSARDPAAKIKLFMGADGNATALRDIWASGADVVHFATHALADLRQPVASLLVLPAMDTNGKATYLTAGQVQGWRGDAELVFLSACESAIGPPQYAVGMPGLQRAFLRAGARGVIATLAPIEDVFAQQFAADFYTRYTSGETAARALSETQRDWLLPKAGMSDDDLLRRRITALSHAYFTG